MYDVDKSIDGISHPAFIREQRILLWSHVERCSQRYLTSLSWFIARLIFLLLLDLTSPFCSANFDFIFFLFGRFPGSNCFVQTRSKFSLLCIEHEAFCTLIPRTRQSLHETKYWTFFCSTTTFFPSNIFTSIFTFKSINKSHQSLCTRNKLSL